MFFETTYGMGDARTDCLNAVKGYPSSYVFKGARGVYTFAGRYGGLPFSQYFKNAVADISNAVAARGYGGVSVSIDGAVIGDGHGTVSFSIPVDHSSSEDVKNNVRSAIQSMGINVSSDNISISNPSFDSICGTGGTGSPDPGTGSVGAQGATPGTIGSFFDNIASGIGVSTPIALGGLAVVAFLFLKK